LNNPLSRFNQHASQSFNRRDFKSTFYFLEFRKLSLKYKPLNSNRTRSNNSDTCECMRSQPMTAFSPDLYII